MDATYRWTVDEYVLRCALGADVHEVVVEGELDALFFADVLARHGMDDVSIIDADYVDVPHAAVEAIGRPHSVKGRLLALGAAFVAEAATQPLAGTVAIVVDRDYDGTPDDLREFVYQTDGHSVESYAIGEASVSRFLSWVAGRVAEPAGAGGRRPRRRPAAEPAGEWLARVLQGATQVAAVRLVLRRDYPSVGLIRNWRGRFKVRSDGFFDVNQAALARDSLVAAGVAAEGLKEATVAAEEAHVAASPRYLVRGHDYTLLFDKLLKSRWGRRASGLTLTGVPEEAVSRWLVGTVDPTDVDREPLVIALVSRFKGAALAGP